MAAHADCVVNRVDIECLVEEIGAGQREAHAGVDGRIADDGGTDCQLVTDLLVGLRLGVLLGMILKLIRDVIVVEDWCAIALDVRGVLKHLLLLRVPRLH